MAAAHDPDLAMTPNDSIQFPCTLGGILLWGHDSVPPVSVDRLTVLRSRAYTGGPRGLAANSCMKVQCQERPFPEC